MAKNAALLHIWSGFFFQCTQISPYSVWTLPPTLKKKQIQENVNLIYICITRLMDVLVPLPLNFHCIQRQIWKFLLVEENSTMSRMITFSEVKGSCNLLYCWFLFPDSWNIINSFKGMVMVAWLLSQLVPPQNKSSLFGLNAKNKILSRFLKCSCCFKCKNSISEILCYFCAFFTSTRTPTTG